MLGRRDDAEGGAGTASLSAAEPQPPCKALQQFFGRVGQVQASPYVLMVGEVCGSNITWLGERGYRIHLERDVRERPDGTFAGALLWDTLSMMPKALARKRADVLHRMLAPGAPVLAFFGPQTQATPTARTRFRILSESLVIAERVAGKAATAHPYQNRDIVQVFHLFEMETLQLHRNGRRDALFYKAWKTPAKP